MNDRQGAKKLYKAHKTWIAAGVAAATLFSVQAFGGQTVSANTNDDVANAQAAYDNAKQQTSTDGNTYVMASKAKQTTANTYKEYASKTIAPVEGSTATPEQLQNAKDALLKINDQVNQKAAAEKAPAKAAYLSDIQKQATAKTNLDNAVAKQAAEKAAVQNAISEANRVNALQSQILAAHQANVAAQKAEVAAQRDVGESSALSQQAKTSQNESKVAAMPSGESATTAKQSTTTQAQSDARQAATKALGDVLSSMKSFAATEGIPNASDFDALIAQGDQAYQDAVSGKTTTSETQQQADNATTALNTVKAQYAATKALGDVLSNMKNFAANKDIPNADDFNALIAQGEAAYQDALNGKTTIAETQQLADNATTVFNTVKAQYAAAKQQAYIAAKAANQRSAGESANMANQIKNSQKQTDAIAAQVAKDATRTGSIADTPNLSTRASDIARDAARTGNIADTENLSTRASNIARDAARGGNIADTPNMSTIASDAARGGNIADTPNMSTIASDAARGGTIADTPNMSTIASDAARGGTIADTPNMSTIASDAARGGTIADTPNMSTIASDAARTGSIADTPNLSTRASDEARAAAEAEKKPEAKVEKLSTDKKLSPAKHFVAAKTHSLTNTAAKATTAATMPKTGDDQNTAATAIGVVAAMSALFGLAGTSMKKRRI